MSRATAVRHEESGFVLLTSMIMLSLMLVLSAGLLAITNTQLGESKAQRVRETSFNLAEAGLNAQIFSLARDWPGTGAALTQYPTCTQTATSARCPSSAQMTSLVPSNDAAGATWQTTVRDNGSAGTANFYSDSLVQSQPAYDANHDGQLWVRSSATAQGKTRTIVALVRAEQQDEDLPHAALITGRLDISNVGNKTIIDASAGAGMPTAVVRCVPALLEVTPCLGHAMGVPPIGGTLAALTTFLGRQLSPNTSTTGYGGGPAMTPEARARLKATAIADGTYFTSCPSTLTGHVVYIEVAPSTMCTYNGNDTYNSAGDPGMVLMATGQLYLGGTTIFNGVIYHANTTNSTGAVLQLQGNTNIIGGVLVDGDATTIAGSSKVNIQLSPTAFRAVKSYGSAGIIQNTWREIRSH